MDKKEQAESLKHLNKLAQQTKKELEKSVPLPTSPLLIQAHQLFTESLRAYLDSMEHVRSDQNSNALTPATIANSMTLFHNNWLMAQEKVYHSFAAWESAYVTKQPMPKETPTRVSTDQWKQYPFHYRTYLAAASMASGNQWQNYNPEDLTARLDMLVASTDAGTLGINDFAAAVKLLHATDAVHAGDFKDLNSRLYTGLKTPEIPLYK
ncbi:hypothetical protein [Brevibacillus sp. NRS-1366]|uniref:hypothetical protein n=1 Tax=Brevibacillus sp. NRS-1366 TaxID=3233899 RepID=UPI003D20D1AA